MNPLSHQFRWIASIGLLLASSVQAQQIVKCSKPGTTDQIVKAATVTALNYMEHGYSCQLVELETPVVQQAVIKSETSRESREAPMTTVSRNNFQRDLSYRECVETLRSNQPVITAEMMRCYRRVAPEVTRGQPLTPEHAALLSVQIPLASLMSEEKAPSRAMVLESASSKSEPVESCLKLREAAYRALNEASDKQLLKFVRAGEKVNKRLQNVDEVERTRLTDWLNGQIVSLIGISAKVQKCSLGARRSSLGQNQTPAERTRTRLSIKGSGSFNFTNEVFAMAVKVKSGRSNLANSAD